MVRVFMSHSSKDKDFVRTLAVDLRANDVDVWLDEWEIRVGQCIMLSVEKAVEDANFLIHVLTESAVASKWVEREWRTAYWDQISDGKERVLPILKEDCRVPGFLKTIKYADFRSDYKSGLFGLLRAIDAERFSDRDKLRLFSDRHRWRETPLAKAFKWLMDRDGLRNIEELFAVDVPNSATDALRAIGSALERIRDELGEPSRVDDATKKRIDEMVTALGVTEELAAQTVLTSASASKVIDAVGDLFEGFLIAWDRDSSLSESEWVDLGEKAMDAALASARVILDARLRHGGVGVEEDDARSWLANILYLAGGDAYASFQLPLRLKIEALTLSQEGRNDLAWVALKAWIFSVYLAEGYEERVSTIEEYLGDLHWNDDGVEQELAVDVLKWCLMETPLEVPRNVVAERVRRRARDESLDEDVVEKLLGLAEVLSSGATDTE